MKLSFRRLKDSVSLKNSLHKANSAVKKTLLNVIIFLILLGLAYVILSPLIGIVSDSFKSMRDVYNPLVYLFPKTGTMENYQMAFKYMDFTKVFPKTIVYSTAMTCLQVLVTSLVGYGFARFRFPGRNIWFALVIMTIVVPPQTIMVTMYTQFQSLQNLNIPLIGSKWINTYKPMTIMTAFGIGLKSGLYIFIFRQFFRGLPKEIEEAATVDGSGVFGTYVRIMLPNAIPSILTVVLFSYVWQYNDTYFASMLMNQLHIMSVRLANIGATYGAKEKINDPNHIRVVVNAAIVLGIAPIVALYMLLQKYFMEGIERSGIVG